MELEQITPQVVTWIIDWGLHVLGALVLLLVGWTVARIVRGSVRRNLARSSVDATLQPFIAGLVYYALLAVVLIAVLNLFGMQTTSLVAILGAAGLAVGLALQGTLSNFASGIMLLLFRPLRVGDFVEAGGVRGAVIEIGTFATTLKTPDNVRVTVPNSKIYGDTIHNYNGFDLRRVDLVMGIDYGDDIGTAIETMESIVRADERVLADPELLIAVSGLGDSAVEIVVRPWCNAADYWPLRFELTRRLKEGLEAAGCSFPFPQRDVHVHREDGE